VKQIKNKERMLKAF